MSIITRCAAMAFCAQDAYHNNNTTVSYDDNETRMYLHGHLIAVWSPTEFRVTLAGFGTPTTRRRINGLLRRLYTEKGWLFHPQMAQRDFKQVLISIDAETGAELITIIDSDDWVGINKETGKAACLARPTNLRPCSPK
jgi:hypothetical protein